MEDRVTEVEGGESNDQHLFRWDVCFHVRMREYMCACVRVYVHVCISPLGWALCRTSVPGAQTHSLTLLWSV